MAILSLISYITPIALTYLLIISTTTTTTTAVNVTNLFSSLPDYSAFASLLSTTGVADELTHRDSVTLLALTNNNLAASEEIMRHLSPSSLADLLRYHVLLRFISWSDLHQIPPSGSLFTTLFQTTGRAFSDSGSVNVTCDSSGTVTIHTSSTDVAPSSAPNATVLSVVKTMPYNITILAMDSILVPSGFYLMASETNPPMGLNITEQLIQGHNFNVAASMFAASGVEGDFESEERGAGITLFVPTDTAFTDIPDNVKLQSLSAGNKAVVLKFHVLHSYYTLGSLNSIVNPVQPTIATETMGAGSYTLNISRVNGSVWINTGIVQTTVTQTVFDQNPVAIFGISKVLLPKELFGNDPSAVTGKTGNGLPPRAQSPDTSLSPENPPEFDNPPSLFSSPPAENIRSGYGNSGVKRISYIILALSCTGLYVLV